MTTDRDDWVSRGYLGANYNEEAMVTMKSSWVRGLRAGLVAALVAGALAVGGIAAVAEAPKDVPSGHIASESVNLLISKGYLPLYDDGTFKGNNAVDRYTFAIAISRLLKDMEVGRVKVSDDDMKLVQKLSTEFREELVSQGVQVDRLRSDLAALKGDLSAKESLQAKGESQQTQDIVAVAKRATQAADGLVALDKRIAAIDDKVSKGAVGGDSLKAMQAKIDTLENDLAATRQKAASDASYMKTLALVSALGGLMLSILVGAAK